MKNFINTIKNAYLYAYYECYLQTHIYYKKSKDKNFYSILTLGGVIVFLLIFPMMGLYKKIFGFNKLIYILWIIYALGHMYLTSSLVGDDDLTDKINSFYDNKKVVKESRRIVIGFVILCILCWIFMIKYDY